MLLLLMMTNPSAIQATNPIGLQWLQSKQAKDFIKARPSGLLYRPMNNGTGLFHPSLDAYCKVDLEISRILPADQDDDNVVNRYNNDKDNEPRVRLEIVETTTLGEPKLIRPQDDATLVPAIQEALQLMVEGDWWELYVPSHLGYNGISDDGVHKNNNTTGNDEDDAALMISLELVSITGGDPIPQGEYYECYLQVQEDPETANYYSILPTADCNEQEVQYISKWTAVAKDQRSAKVERELMRLQNMLRKNNSGANMKQSLAVWVRRRIHLLKLFLHDRIRLCTVSVVNTVYTPVDCNVQEQDYIHKVFQQWDLPLVQEEIIRLSRMEPESMDAVLASWVRKRIRILKQLQHTLQHKDKNPTEEVSLQPNGDSADNNNNSNQHHDKEEQEGTPPQPDQPQNNNEGGGAHEEL